MSLLSTLTLLLHSFSVFSSVTNSVLIVPKTVFAWINILTELKPWITVQRELRITQQDTRHELSVLWMFNLEQHNALRKFKGAKHITTIFVRQNCTNCISVIPQVMKLYILQGYCYYYHRQKGQRMEIKWRSYTVDFHSFEKDNVFSEPLTSPLAPSSSQILQPLPLSTYSHTNKSKSRDTFAIKKLSTFMLPGGFPW